jgi:hypothetical protein
MTPQRLACKFDVSPDPTATPDLHPFIALFHRFIQQQVLDGLLIDVADYAHVPDGPGVMLIGHEADYALDLAEGRAGLLVLRKRPDGEDLPALLRDALRRGLRAIDAIERDGAAGLRFAPGSVTVQIVDRLAAPNDADTFAAVSTAVRPVLAQVYGEKVELERVHADDPRKTLAFRVTSRESAPAAELASRLAR